MIDTIYIYRLEIYGDIIFMYHIHTLSRFIDLSWIYHDLCCLMLMFIKVITASCSERNFSGQWRRCLCRSRAGAGSDGRDLSSDNFCISLILFRLMIDNVHLYIVWYNIYIYIHCSMMFDHRGYWCFMIFVTQTMSADRMVLDGFAVWRCGVRWARWKMQSKASASPGRAPNMATMEPNGRKMPKKITSCLA